MTKMLAVRVESSLLVVVMLGSVSALGVPEGAAGSKDFRYPDTMVSPPVPCPSEGVFPHPRNCSSYYRCFDRYGYGFYWRSYFDCGKGTEFSDELDLCVHAEGDGKGCSKSNVCHQTLEECRTDCTLEIPGFVDWVSIPVEICSNARKSCPGQPDKPICHPDSVYDITHDNCNEVYRYSCARPMCRLVTGDCSSIDICYNINPVPRLRAKVDVCKNAQWLCTDTVTRPLCPHGTLYDRTNQVCIKETCPLETTEYLRPSPGYILHHENGLTEQT